MERHGAIRVGTAEELATLRRMFAIMGMYPVSYYDLAGRRAGPLHSVSSHRRCRAGAQSISDFHLAAAPELIENRALRERAEAILARRKIFTPAARR